MNILILSWRGPNHPHAGGAEQSTHQHASGWIKGGHSVTLFTSSFQGAKEEEQLDGVNIIRKGGQVFGVHFKAFIWYLFSNHPKYDLIIDQFHGIPFFTPIYIRQKKLAFIHEVTKEVWSLNPWPKPLNLIPAFLGRVFEPIIFKLFYKNIPFFTVSNSTKNDLMQWGIPLKNITVINNGVSLPKNRKKILKEKNNTLIFLGAISKDKGIEDALKVFSEISRTMPNYRFWVVGKGETNYQNDLKDLTVKLGIETKVKFWGYVSEDKKFELLTRSHLLINPSIREGWGLVVIEAATMGTPTIAFNVPGLKDSIMDGITGILEKPYSCENMARKIIELLDDITRYEIMKSEAQKWSRNFSWEKSVNQSLDLIRKIRENT